MHVTRAADGDQARRKAGSEATALTVTTMSLLAAFAGMEHGIGEVLQGPIAPPAPVFRSWGDSRVQPPQRRACTDPDTQLAGLRDPRRHRFPLPGTLVGALCPQTTSSQRTGRPGGGVAARRRRFRTSRTGNPGSPAGNPHRFPDPKEAKPHDGRPRCTLAMAACGPHSVLPGPGSRDRPALSGLAGRQPCARCRADCRGFFLRPPCLGQRPRARPAHAFPRKGRLHGIGRTLRRLGPLDRAAPPIPDGDRPWGTIRS